MIPSTAAGMDPILFDRSFIDYEHIPRVGPFFDRVLQARKVAPPERVALQPVVVEGRGQHREPLLLGGAGRLCSISRQTQESLRQILPGLRPLRARCGCRFGLHRLAAGLDLIEHPRILGSCQEPSPQPKRREAVVAVVILQVVEVLPGCCGVGFPQFAILLVRQDGSAARGHAILIAQPVAHVERLELLDAVGRRRDTNGATHGRVQIDEDFLSQQCVELVLLDLVGHYRARSTVFGNPLPAARGCMTLKPWDDHNQSDQSVTRRCRFAVSFVNTLPGLGNIQDRTTSQLKACSVDSLS